MTRRFLGALAALFFAVPAHAQSQFPGLTLPPQSVIGNPLPVPSDGSAIPFSILTNSLLAGISSGSITNSMLATMPATTFKCNPTSGSATPTDCKLPVVNVLDFATGNCSSDDSTAIQNAINSLTNGGTVYFPPAPGGCYAIGSGTAITLPTGSKPIALIGAGRGSVESPSASRLKATAVIGSIIKTSTTTFSRGHRISNMTIDGNNNAAICLQIDLLGSSTFDNLDIINCTTTNFRLGTTGLNAIENTLFNIRLDNPLNSHPPAALPAVNLDVWSTNNFISNILAVNASTANIRTRSGASFNNQFNAVHGYNFDYTSQVPTASSTNNFLIEGTGDQFVNWEVDGSSAVNVQVNGFQNLLSNGVSLYASGLTAQVGIRFANATCFNQVVNNVLFNSSAANSIVQTGGSCSPGNFVSLNFNGTNGSGIGFAGDPLGHIRSFAITAPTITAGCNGAGSSVRTNSTDVAGEITGQTAAATTCTITFANQYSSLTAPFCTVSGQTTPVTSYTISSTALVVNFASTASAKFNWVCMGM